LSGDRLAVSINWLPANPWHSCARPAWSSAFQQQTGLAVDAQFGPAGLLRERIEAGTPCAVFACC
jgi:hypothetical protein